MSEAAMRYGVSVADKPEYDYRVVAGVDITTFKPMSKHLVVRWLKKVESKGGILYPENRQRKNYMKGEVLVPAPDSDPDIKKGSIVQFDALADKEFIGVQDPADRDTVFIMREEDVHGVLINSFTNNRQQWIFEPMNEYVLIKPECGMAEASGLIVPGTVSKATVKIWCGTVIAAGPRVKEEPKYRDLDILPGKRFVYDAFTSNEVILNDEKHEVVRADYIMAEMDAEVNVHLVGA